MANHAYWDVFSANRGNVLYNRRRACFPVGAVAPHAGAWIETKPHGAGIPHRQVAPHAGAHM